MGCPWLKWLPALHPLLLGGVPPAHNRRRLSLCRGDAPRRLFGDNEEIVGYDGLNIDVWFTPLFQVTCTASWRGGGVVHGWGAGAGAGAGTPAAGEPKECHQLPGAPDDDAWG